MLCLDWEKKHRKNKKGFFWWTVCWVIANFSLFVKQLETGKGSEKGGGLEGGNAKEMYLAHPENTAILQIIQY